MTREDIKTIIDIVHKTIYGFFDVCDEEETPMTDKDKLLLKINKAICTNIKALEQEPCGDAILREDAIRTLRADDLFVCTGDKMQAISDIEGLSPVNPQEPKWILVSEGFPEDEDYVLVCYADGSIRTAYYYIDTESEDKE